MTEGKVEPDTNFLREADLWILNAGGVFLSRTNNWYGGINATLSVRDDTDWRDMVLRMVSHVRSKGSCIGSMISGGTTP
jgi:hypothetical protein